jgi:hypothetical protein
LWIFSWAEISAVKKRKEMEEGCREEFLERLSKVDG